MIFLIHYDRQSSKLVSLQAFDDRARQAASTAKMELEISLIGADGADEVVLLEAESEQDLRKTHQRYFSTLEELSKKPSSGS